MAPPRSERAIRRLVAQLATLALQDIDAILADLNEAQQARVRDLLEAYARTRTAALDGLSSWLGERVGFALDLSQPTTANRFGSANPDMTPRALAALRRAADTLPRRDDADRKPSGRRLRDIFGLARRTALAAAR